jgi:hypothetical protein
MTGLERLELWLLESPQTRRVSYIDRYDGRFQIAVFDRNTGENSFGAGRTLDAAMAQVMDNQPPR